MAEARAPQIYSIAAHRGFADALVAGLVPRYADPDVGLARLTLLLPSARAARTVTEAFVRHAGATGTPGLLMPRMVMVGDLDLDEALGPVFDSLGAGAAIPPAADSTRRWLRLAQFVAEAGAKLGRDPLTAGARLRLAQDIATSMDRLLVEEIEVESLWEDRVLSALEDNAIHWRENTKLFYAVSKMWQAELAARGELDAAARRNLLFREAARRMRDTPPATPYVAAGVTSAAPALARLLRTVSELPQGAVILPDLDLSMDDAVWDELGGAGDPEAQTPFARGDAVTHPQYHLKLLLNRMGVARAEVQPWHRAGLSKGPPERSHAISSLFLPPDASKAWVDLPANRRRMTGVRLVEAANPEEEAQAIALLVREAVEAPKRRVAVVTPDRGLAARVVQHLRRWNIMADDSAGRPLSQTAAGRVILLLAEIAAERAAPVPLIALLEHPLAAAGEGRPDWLDAARAFELKLRGPRKTPGLESLRALADEAKVADWWGRVEDILAPLVEQVADRGLADWLDLLAEAGEALCGTDLWAREDGRALAAFIEDLRLQTREVPVALEPADLPPVLRDAMDDVAVRPSYGGHPRVAILGLLEARMTRADLVICAGLNEGTWPPTPSVDPLLAPGVLRALGVPGADFRIGLAAHDLAGALGAPEVVLSRARREVSGPAIASRFLLRVRALLGQRMTEEASDRSIVDLARAVDDGRNHDPAPHPQPRVVPRADQRLPPKGISVTALDRLRSDPYEYYAGKILRLDQLDGVDADPGPAWQGTLAHAILQDWHDGKGSLDDLADRHLQALSAHPLLAALWRPRLVRALEWVALSLDEQPGRTPLAVEAWGEMAVQGVRVFGKADRIDRMPGGALAVVDYKTGAPPAGAEVEAGYALQLGTLGLIVRAGGFADLAGTPETFEYWSLGRDAKSVTGFGYVTTPLLEGNKRSGIAPGEFLPVTERFLLDALDSWILGDAPFVARLNPDAPGYATYDQLMRLAEWQGREAQA
ncbi:double-strand break repair protein AddB [Erythrobacter arachoides]|uniref:Double-strand break repair protein AddB n=1 Tax=Aurantiacibacter arachoides TaxID=1850444 RepID=A0A844ZXY3_9SPHN|nr:PD-(D/E)XK nuclease family protein [Aurantiacibacter arachoides]MXO92993.1 double-strand break repair protein AddB [Aurantiacibacter arachoides]GGD52827.1 double-strand break repair protein AddB [Aurantiacibacter arachoides]